MWHLTLIKKLNNKRKFQINRKFNKLANSKKMNQMIFKLSNRNLLILLIQI